MNLFISRPGDATQGFDFGPGVDHGSTDGTDHYLAGVRDMWAVPVTGEMLVHTFLMSDDACAVWVAHTVPDCRPRNLRLASRLRRSGASRVAPPTILEVAR